ncbi:MAG: SRPBCC family protein [Chthoniobacterales bacterium]|jgi:ligand-binding SRPBCC domain-containing protein|nr:SRPBCC family protein [Chthoniobacterales bacterium]
MPVFERSIQVAATPEELFRFHENPHNLRSISPPGLRILEIHANREARAGEEFRIAAGRGPCTLRWTGRWEKVAPPHSLADTGVQCPFSAWRHEHRFTPHPDGGTLLADRVEFRLAWSRGGPAAAWFLLRFVFPGIFAARHAATRQYFAALRAKNPLAGDGLS